MPKNITADMIIPPKMDIVFISEFIPTSQSHLVMENLRYMQVDL